MNASRTQERPIGELFSELARETATLVGHEVKLAKLEVTRTAKAASYDVAQIAIGGVISVIGVLSLSAAVILIVGTVLPLWAAALIVGLALCALGGGLALLGARALKQLDAAPRQTIQTLREDKQWLREQLTQ